MRTVYRLSLIHIYLKEYPDSRLIVIDTLQKVRTASKDNAYASDYGDISQIKEFADRHSLAVIVVHHIRKQNDSDVFNKVSGTTGLTGSADATFVLEKETRASDTCLLYTSFYFERFIFSAAIQQVNQFYLVNHNNVE